MSALDPLTTRSLPGALWEHVPAWLSSTDQLLRERLCFEGFSAGALGRDLRWITEDARGIFGLLLIAILARRFVFSRSLRADWLSVLAALPLIGLADLVSSGVKLSVGRLKPHVNFYNPSLVPALSLPSNHAVNTALAATLYLLVVRFDSRAARIQQMLVASALVLLVGFSRIFLGQHYPLDVLVGWVMGISLGIFLKRPYLLARSFLETFFSGVKPVSVSPNP